MFHESSETRLEKPYRPLCPPWICFDISQQAFNVLVPGYLLNGLYIYPPFR